MCRILFFGLDDCTIRPRRLSARGSGFLLRKNGADQPRLNSVVQLCRALPRV